MDVNIGEAAAVWETCDFLRSVGVYRDGCFYFTSLRGNAYCVTTDGEIRWKRQLGAKSGSADWNVVLEGDRLLMAQDALYCLDPETGETVWANEESAYGSCCTIIVEEEVIYHAKSGGHIYCCDRFDGKTVWTYGSKEWCRGALAVDASTLMYADSHGKFLFIDKMDGHLVREVAAGGKLMKPPVMVGKRLFGGENLQPSGGCMMCWELGESYELKPVFEAPAKSAVTSQAVFIGEKLFFGTEDGSVYCVNRETGEEIEKKKVKGACRGIVPCRDGFVALSDKGPAMGLA